MNVYPDCLLAESHRLYSLFKMRIIRLLKIIFQYPSTLHLTLESIVLATTKVDGANLTPTLSAQHN